MSLSTKEAVLKALLAAEGGWISGAKLASSVFVSRNAVWQAVQNLLKEGYPIESVTGKGYRLTGSDPPLSTAGITLYLDKPTPYRLLIKDSLPSTNTCLKDLARKGAEDGLVLLARSQSAGRGRLGRTFFSPAETGLYFSLLLRPQAAESAFGPAADLPLSEWPIRTALAVALSIEALTGDSCQIKWVNDLYMNEKKVGGILTEAELDLETGTPAFIVIGIGLNLTQPVKGFPKELDHIAGSIKNCGPERSEQKAVPDFKNRLVGSILNQLLTVACFYSEEKVRTAYSERSFLTNKIVRITSGKEMFDARVIGLGEKFSLLVEDKKGQRRSVRSGEASLHNNRF